MSRVLLITLADFNSDVSHYSERDRINMNTSIKIAGQWSFDYYSFSDILYLSYIDLTCKLGRAFQ